MTDHRAGAEGPDPPGDTPGAGTRTGRLGEATNAGVAALITVTMLARRPLTLRYEREPQPPRRLWSSPEPLNLHYALSAAWASAFLISAAAGLYGELALHNSRNAWTNWIIQITAVAAAAVFTSWYPRVVRAGSAAPPVSDFLDPLLKLAAAVGVVSLALGIAPVWFGVALIVIGLVGVLAIHQSVLSEPPEPLR